MGRSAAGVSARTSRATPPAAALVTLAAEMALASTEDAPVLVKVTRFAQVCDLPTVISD